MPATSVVARRSVAGPQLVKKRQTRLAGLDDRVLGIYDGGMSVRDNARHLSDPRRSEAA